MFQTPNRLRRGLVKPVHDGAVFFSPRTPRAMQITSADRLVPVQAPKRPESEGPTLSVSIPGIELLSDTTRSELYYVRPTRSSAPWTGRAHGRPHRRRDPTEDRSWIPLRRPRHELFWDCQVGAASPKRPGVVGLGGVNVQRGPFILSEIISRYQTYKKLDGSYENISYLAKSEQP